MTADQLQPAPAPKRRRGRPRLPPEERAENNSTIQSLERGLNLLQLLARSGSASLSDLSLQSGLPASTAYRMLSTMQKLEFVTFDESIQEWSVGIEAFTVGSSYFNRANLAEVSRPVMRQLMLDTGETANLGMLTDGGHVTFLTQTECTHPIRAFHLPGTRSPAHSSGIGKAMLAELAEHQIEDVLQKTGLQRFTEKTLISSQALFNDLDATYKRGWAFDDEERHIGMRCIAAAIHDTQGSAIAGISISGPTARFGDSELSQFGTRVRQAADEVTHLIGGVVPEYTQRTL